MTGLWKPRVATVLKNASVAYLAVETKSGPHVTPLLFAVTPDRVWFGIGRGTLKARVLAKRPAVGVVVGGARGSIAIRGQATLLDRLPLAPAELARAAFALPAYASGNALEMAAFARDVAIRGARPQPLAPLSVAIDSLDLLDDWPPTAVLGWMAPGGPVALPALERADRTSGGSGGAAQGRGRRAHRGRMCLHRREPRARPARQERPAGPRPRSRAAARRRRVGGARAGAHHSLEGLPDGNVSRVISTSTPSPMKLTSPSIAPASGIGFR